MQPLTALSIAGSDSGGGAGIQADIRTFSAFGVHATTALTAITAQNTLGVSGIVTVEPDFVEAQVRAIVTDFDVRATKTGMLAQARTVERVCQLAREGLLPHLVVDPVLVSTSGDALMAEGGIEVYRSALIPLAEVVTPNLHEAAVLCGVDVRDVRDLEDLTMLARTILAMGPTFVLVKGGHLAHTASGEHAPDLLLSRDELIVFDALRVETANDHGTGCSLSAAIAAGLALGRSVLDATRDAKSFVLAALTSASAWRLGQGRGPIDHFGWNE
ncbi:MAG TPA: bifunctional hydroxymethylpyrimidine kinase/phosphomethylpyrimidine kinase [Acidimicrobiales bacterium]|nr:bifunctional hydroxymethylpyrimidine kinase/phosphomethylpyrimidine kinase [Acidimicrobiales bacterium]